MSSVDERIVKMTLDNKDFEKHAKESIKTTDELKEAMKFKNSTEALEAFSRQLTNIEKSTSSAESSLNKMSKYSTTVFGQMLSTIKSKVSSALLSVPTAIFKNVTTPIREAFAQIESGGWKRSSNIKEAQFQLKGLGVTGAKLAKVMEDVNYGVSGTAYGLDAAAKAASQLTASGVTAGDSMKAALRGISGVAAMTSSSYEDISSIFTTVAGNGKLMTQQLRQFSFRGLNAAATLGEQLGKTEEEINKMVSKGEIDFATFSKAMDDAFGEHAKDANETYTGSLDNMKAALSRIGESIASAKIDSMVGVFNSCRMAINSLHVQFQPLIDTFATFAKIKNDALKGLINSFTELDESGTRVMKSGLKLSEMAEGMSRIMWNFRSVMYAIQLGLKDILGESNPLVKVIGGLSSGVNALSKATQPTAETLYKIRKGTTLLITPFQKIGQLLGWLGTQFSFIWSKIKDSSVVKTITTMSIMTLPSLSKALTGLKLSLRGITLVGNGKNFDKISKSVSNLVIKLKTLVKESKTLEAIKERLSKVSLNGIITKLGNVLGILAEKITSVAKAIAGSKVWSNIKPFIKNVLSELDTRISSLIKNGSTLFSGLRKNTSVMSSIGKVLTTIKTAVSAIIPYIVSGAKHIASIITGVKDFNTAIQPTTELVKTTSEVLGQTNNLGGPNTMVGQVVELGGQLEETVAKPSLLKSIKDFGNGVADFFKGMGSSYKQNQSQIESGFSMMKSIATFLIGFVSWVAILRQVNAATKVMQSTSEMLDNIGEAFKTFADKLQHPFSNITNITNNIQNVGMNTPILLQLSAMLVAIAGSVAVLGRMRKEDLIQGSVTLGALATLMGVLAIVLKAITVKVIPAGKKFASSGVAATILSLTVSLVAITASLKALEKLQISENLIGSMVLLSGVLYVLGRVVAEISTLSGQHSVKSAIVVISLALAIKSLAHTLVDVTESVKELDYEELLKGFAVLTSAVALISVLGLAMTKVGFKGAVGLIAIILASNKVANLINEMINTIDWANIEKKVQQYKKNIIGTVGALVAVGALFAVMGAGIKAFGAGILSLIVAVGLVTVLAKLLKGLTVWDIVGALIATASIAFALGLLITDLSGITVDKDNIKNLSKLIGRVTRFFIAMGVLAAVLGILPDDVAIQGGIILGAFTLMLDSLMLCAGKAKDVKMNTLIALTGSIVVLFATMLTLGLLMRKNSDIVYNGLVALVILLAPLAVILHQMKYIKRSYNKNAFKVMLAGVAMLATIAASLYLLSGKDYGHLAAASVALIAVIVALGQVFKAIFNIRWSENNFKKVAATLLLGVGLLSEIVTALAVLSLFDPISVLASMIAIDGVLVALTKCIDKLFSINYNKNRIKMVGNIILLAVGLLASISGAIALVANSAEWISILASAAAISLVLVAFTAVLKIMTTMSGDASKSLAVAGSIVLAALSLLEIAAALMMVASIGDVGLILASMIAIDGVLLAFGAVLAIMSLLGTNVAGALAGAGSLVLAGVALLEIATALWMVAKAGDFEQLMGAMIAIDGVLIAFGAVVAIMSILGTNVVGALVGAGSIVLAGLALLEIGYVLGNLAQYDWQNLEAASNAINKTLLALTAAVAVMTLLGPVAIVGAGVLDIVALVLGVGLVEIFNLVGYLYEQADYVEKGLEFIKLLAGKMGEAFGAFIGGIAAGAMEELNKAADDLVEFGQKFAVFAAELNFIKGLDPDWSVVGDMLTAIADMTKSGLLTSLENFIGSKLFGENGLETSLTKFGAAVQTLTSIVSGANAAALTNGMSVIKQFEADIDAISALSDKYSDMSNISNFATQMRAMGDLGISEFGNSLALADVTTPITNLFTAIQNAVNLQKTVAINAFQKLGTDLTTSINTFYSNFYQSGMYLVQGLTNGLKNSVMLAQLQEAAENLGTITDTAFRNDMEIHSPSVKMAKNGKYVVEGLAKGIGTNGSVVVDEIDELVKYNVEKETINQLKVVAKSIDKQTQKGIKFVYDEATGKVIQENNSFFDTLDTKTIDGFDDLKKTAMDQVKKVDFGQFTTLLESKSTIITSVMKQLGVENGEAFLNGLKSSLMSGKGWDEAFSEALGGVGLDLSSVQNAFASVGDSSDDAADSLEGYASAADGAGGSSSDAAEKARTLAEYNWIVEKATVAVNSAFGLMSNQVTDTNTVVTKFGANFDQVAEVMYKASRTGSEAFDDLFTETGAGLDDFKSKVVETFKSILDSFEGTFNMMSSASNPFEGMLSGKQMVRNLQDQVSQVASVGVKLTRLAMKDVNSELLNELAEGGASSLSQINSLLRASSEEIQQINALYLQKSSVAQISAIQSVNAMAIAAQRDIYEAQAATGDATAAILLQYSNLESDAIEYINEYIDRFEYASTTIREVVANGISTFEEFDFTVEKSAADFVKNMWSQVEGARQWEANLEKIMAMGASDELINALVQKGQDGGFEIAAALAMGTAEQIASANAAMIAQKNIPDELASKFGDAYAIAGSASADKFIEDFAKLLAMDSDGKILEATGIMAASTCQDLKNYLLNGGNGPGIRTVCTAFLGEMAKKIRTGSNIPSAAATQMGSDTVAGSAKYVNNSTGSTQGMYFMQGLASSIGPGSYYAQQAIAAAAATARLVAQALHDGLGNGSPSKLARQEGIWFEQGLINGLHSMAKKVDSTAEDVNNPVVDALREAMAKSTEIFDETNVNPVIKPVLDLTEIQNGANLLTNMLPSTIPTTGIMSGMSFGAVEGNNLGTMIAAAVKTGLNGMNFNNNVNYTQNNYSPKALDRIEIYRQTNNQFTALKEALR